MSLYPPDNSPYFSHNLFLLSQAEYGKFLPIALSAAPVGFPTLSGSQPYAILTYELNPSTTVINTSALYVSVSSVSIKDAGTSANAPVDATKGLKVDPYHTILKKSSNGLTTGFKVLSTAGNLGTINGGINPSSESGFVQIFDSLTFPVSGSTPLLSFFVPASGTFSLDYGDNGIPVSNGLVIVSSSTFSTYTSAVSANILALATYWL